MDKASDNDISVDLTHLPTLPKQRPNDVFIMDLLMPYFSRAEIFRINKIRLHLQVYLLSDTSTFDGNSLLPDIQKGILHRKSNLEWSRQPLVQKYSIVTNSYFTYST